MLLKNGNILHPFSRIFTTKEYLLHVILISLFLIPIWGFDYFPSVDGPTHIANAKAFLEYFNPQFSVYSEYYTINKSLTPTWFSHLIFSGLLYLFSPEITEKIFLSAYIIFFPIAVQYALQAIKQESSFLSFLSYPFIYNYLLHMGFYAFCFSLPMFFLVIGFWLRHQNRFSQRDTIIFTILSTLLYLFHISVWTWTFSGITILVIWLFFYELIQQRREGDINWSYLWDAFKKRALIPFYACLPVIILIVAFFIDKQFVNVSNDLQGIERFKKLLYIDSLVSFSSLEVLFAKIFSMLFGAIVTYIVVTKFIVRRFTPWDGLIFVFLAYVFLYMFSPETVMITPNGMQGGGYIDKRLNLFPFFALLLWFAAQNYSLLVARGIKLIAICISLAMLTVHTQKNAELNVYINDYLSGMNLIKPNSTILGLSFASKGPVENGLKPSNRVALFTHTVDHIAARRNNVSFTNYEANHGYFPLVYRKELNPYEHIAFDDNILERPLKRSNTEAEFATYFQRTGGKLDYILLWGLTKEHLTNNRVHSILKQLELNYELIHRSPLQHAALYQLIPLSNKDIKKID